VKKIKIFDCVTFFNESELLYLRLNILDEFVDYFVICEAKEDHRGNKKELNFNISKFKKFKNKIIYLVIDKFENCKRTWDRQNYQRDYLINGIASANEDDIILFSDVDEIPNLNNFIDFFKKNSEKIGIFNQKMFYYKLNLQVQDYVIWEGTRVSKKKFIKSFSWLRGNVRLKNLRYKFWRFDKFKKIYEIKNGGWHFSFLGDAYSIAAKIKSYTHSEYDKEKFTNIKNINERILKQIDPYDRNKKLKKISIDKNFPEYLVNNINYYKKWII
tara:strand:+ start:690 stop:1505 length:816 start_codon:yes stop_codon:yes gene_type:complete